MLYLTFIIYVFITIFSIKKYKNAFDPLFVFGLTWSLTLFVLILNQSHYYTLSNHTYLIFIIGALSFLCGSILASIQFHNKKYFNQTILNLSEKRVLFLIILLFCGWFKYYERITAFTNRSNISLMFQESRQNLVQAAQIGENIIGPLANLEVISYFILASVALEKERLKYGNILYLSILLITILYVTPGGSKGGVITIAITNFIIFNFENKLKVIFRNSIFLFIILLILFSIGLYFVNLAYTEFINTFDIFNKLYLTIRNYWIGGLVAFSQVVDNPQSFIPFQDPSRFFIQTANSFGANINLPSIHGDYVFISNDEDTNVYTIFYSYYLFGKHLAVFFFMFLYSFILTIIHRFALYGNRKFIIFSSFLLCHLILSIVSERFFLGLNSSIKMFLFVFFFYKFVNLKEGAYNK